MQSDTIHRPPIPGPAARAVARFGTIDDATATRWTKRLAFGLAIGVLAIGAIYALDRVRLPQPTLADRSVAAAEEAVRTNPNLLSSRLDLARAYIAVGRNTDAIAQYDEVLRVQADVIPALLGRGKLLAALASYDKAATDFATVVTLLKDQEMGPVSVELEDAYFNLGSIALTRGSNEEALAFLDAAVKISATDADALHLYGKALLAVGKPADAIAPIRKAVAMVPWGWCDPYEPLAAAYTATGDADGAAYAGGMLAACQGRTADGAAALTPLVGGTHGLDVLVGLALIAEGRNDAKTAAGYYAQALALDASSFAAINGLNRLGADATGALRSPAPSVEGH
jgi:tetratricopeptide (TPR) repeat protein